MANSKYEYVKSFEVEDEIMFPNLIVVRVGGRHFQRFSEVHEFEKPNDEKALKLMSLCATSVLQEYPDIVFSFGFSDEYSFAFKQTTKFYQRRASKVASIIVSFFTSVYVTKWKEFFPEKELKYPPSFHARPIVCASLEVLQEYLAWRQQHCHITNQHNTCLWELVKSGKTEKEALDILKGTQKQERNELLFQQFGINYRTLPQMFRQGSCVLKTEVEGIVKYSENGTPIKRMRKDPTTVHSKNIAGRSFWNEHQSLLKELGVFTKDVGKINSDYIRSFLFESKLMASTWIVIRIDGCHFHRFSEVHDFEKPNDEQALNLMNSCAVAVLQEFPDVVFSYGVSDEYSFVLKKDSQFCQRKASNIVSIVVSFFTSVYVMNWKAFFPHKELKYCPAFDGRAVCYPSTEILRDYLAWRQVDCHINNQYNTCFWMLVKSGKSKSEAQRTLKGTQAQEKKEMLAWFGIDDYNALPAMFRQGSSVFQDGMVPNENGAACYKNMRDHKERFVVLPFSLGCASQSSVAVAATDKPCRKPKHETKSSHATRRQEGREESSGQEKTRSNTFSSLALPNPNMSSGMHKLVRGIKSLSQIFVYREEEEDDEQMEREMEIGFPTDVKHLTHIGLDGTATTSNPIKGWESLKPPEIISFPSISLSHFELAMAAQAHGSVFEVDHSNLS